jgi:hypothetical protein
VVEGVFAQQLLASRVIRSHEPDSAALLRELALTIERTSGS